MGTNTTPEFKKVLSRYGRDGWNANLGFEFEKRGIRETNDLDEPLSEAQRLIQMFHYEMVGALRRFSAKEVLRVVRDQADLLLNNIHAEDGGFLENADDNIFRLPRSPCGKSCSSDSTESIEEDSDEDNSILGHKRIKKREDPAWVKSHPQRHNG